MVVRNKKSSSKARSFGKKDRSRVEVQQARPWPSAAGGLLGTLLLFLAQMDATLPTLASVVLLLLAGAQFHRLIGCHSSPPSLTISVPLAVSFLDQNGHTRGEDDRSKASSRTQRARPCAHLPLFDAACLA